MKKYLEQRVEELETEVKLLRAKIKLNETKDTSKYVNNYPKYDPFKDYMHNASVNLMSTPDLETAFASPFDKSNFEKNPLVSITTPTNLDTRMYYISAESNYLPSVDSDFPPYPDIWGSYDPNPEDVIEATSNSIPDWGVTSKFDKMDKDFLDWANSHEATNAYEISKHITNKYGKSKYRPFKTK